MKATPVILGACALGIVAGAAGGTAINTRPLANASDTIDQLPEAPTLRDGATGPAQALPNHYPLTTPEGTVPVTELAYHGRFRDTPRYGVHYEPDATIAYADYETWSENDWAEKDWAAGRNHPGTTAHVAPSLQPVEPDLAAAPPQPVKPAAISGMTASGARMVDVASELARIE